MVKNSPTSRSKVQGQTYQFNRIMSTKKQKQKQNPRTCGHLF